MIERISSSLAAYTGTPSGARRRKRSMSLLEQQQRAHAVAEPQCALDHELALGDEDALARALRPLGAQAQRGGAQVRVLAHARVERVVQHHWLLNATVWA